MNLAQQNEISSAVRTILRDKSTQEQVLAAEAHGWNADAWATLVAGGFAGIAVPEEAGGSGGTVAEACAVLHQLGRSATSVPYAEHALVSGWLLARAGKRLSDGIVTVAVVEGSGPAKHVPWASIAQQIIVVVPNADGSAEARLIDAAKARITRGRNLADELRDTVDLDSVVAEDTWALTAADVEQVRLRGALATAALMGGALERVVELSVRYTAEREQFGRPIARFQAIQRHLVRTAEQAQLAMMAYRAAALNAVDTVDYFDGASAKIVAGESATAATAAAHQAHGAIDMTKEYELGQLSRRLWSWRDENGSEAAWARDLGERIATAGADELWPRVSTGLRDELEVGS